MSIRRGHPPEGYVTASRAKKKLGGISDGKFRSYIQAKKIERFVPPGMKQGFYRREDVEKLAKELESPWHGGAKGHGTHFRQATLEDIPAIANIDECIFNASEEEPTPRKIYLRQSEETYSRWLRRNPQSLFVLSNEASKVVGFASLPPLKKNTLDLLVRDEISWTDIPNEDIDLFQPGRLLHLYVMALCIDPSYTRATKERYAARMIRGLFDFILSLAKQGIEIEDITARNQLDKPDGKRLLQKLGIPQLRSPIAHINLFSVRMADSGYPAFVEYYDTLVQWKQEHERSKT
jgi:hypothetical protein